MTLSKSHSIKSDTKKVSPNYVHATRIFVYCDHNCRSSNKRGQNLTGHLKFEKDFQVTIQPFNKYQRHYMKHFLALGLAPIQAIRLITESSVSRRKFKMPSGLIWHYLLKPKMTREVKIQGKNGFINDVSKLMISVTNNMTILGSMSNRPKYRNQAP